MAGQTDPEKETLRVAAEAATTMLLRLRKQRARMDGRITALESIVAGWESVCGRKGKAVSLAGAPEPEAGPRQPRARRGLVEEQIDAVLADDREYEEPELRSAINERFGTTYGRGTVYSNLHRGAQEKGKYENNDGKWRRRKPAEVKATTA